MLAVARRIPSTDRNQALHSFTSSIYPIKFHINNIRTIYMLHIKCNIIKKIWNSVTLRTFPHKGKVPTAIFEQHKTNPQTRLPTTLSLLKVAAKPLTTAVVDRGVNWRCLKLCLWALPRSLCWTLKDEVVDATFTPSTLISYIVEMTSDQFIMSDWHYSSIPRVNRRTYNLWPVWRGHCQLYWLKELLGL